MWAPHCGRFQHRSGYPPRTRPYRRTSKSSTKVLAWILDEGPRSRPRSGHGPESYEIEFSKSMAETLIFGSKGSADLRTPTSHSRRSFLFDSAKVGEDTYLVVPSTLVGRRAVGGDGVGYV